MPAERQIDGHFGADAAGQRLDRALADAVPDLSRERLKSLMSEGRVSLDGKDPPSASHKVREGQHWQVLVPEASEASAAPEDIALNIAFEDEHLIVIDKPAGMVVHPAAGHDKGTLVNALLHHCRGQLSGIGGVARPGIVHRIDKDTSGLLVVAKSDIAHEGLARQFADHSIERVYAAITQGVPNPRKGTISGAIGRSSHDRKKMALVADGRGKHAVTHYAVIETLRDAALIECRLETGRTHQVRVHMASIGHALLGDPYYARPSRNLRPTLRELGFERQALHAAMLGFVHPVTRETLQFSSPWPADFAELKAALTR